jgi:hypothetical protein
MNGAASAAVTGLGKVIRGLRRTFPRTPIPELSRYFWTRLKTVREPSYGKKLGVRGLPVCALGQAQPLWLGMPAAIASSASLQRQILQR